MHPVGNHAIEPLMNAINEEQKMINGFIASIKKRNPQKQ
jgi:hypothetical protein